MPIERIEVRNHRAFGQMVVKWSMDKSSRPATLDDLKTACAGLLSIPDRITKLRYIDVDLKTLTIRVPNKQMVEESVARFKDVPDSHDYPAPPFYDLIGGNNSPPALETLYSRIADYTIAQCQ